MFRFMQPRSAWLLLALGLAAGVWAQAEIRKPPAPSGFGWKQNLPLGLLREQRVQRDLKLSQRDIAEVESLAADIAKSKASTLEGMPKVLSVPDTFQPRWASLLTADQRSRLAQIELQRAPLLDVLTEPEVVTELMLSAEQKEAILEMYKRNYRRNAAAEAKGVELGDEKPKYDKPLHALLSTQQQRALERLRGELVREDDQ